MITAMPRIAIAMHDFDEAVRLFRDVFGMPVEDHSAHVVPTLGAHVGMAVPELGSNVELMSPADNTKPLSQALQKFLDRRGDGLYALMLEAPVPDEEAVGLAERGLDVLPLMPGAHGRDVHPRSTHGVLIRVYPDNSAPPRGDRTSQAPGLSGITRVVIATTDADSAAKAYGHGFGLPVDPATTDAERGVRSVICRPPAGGVIELVSPTDTTRPFAQDIADFSRTRGEGMFALVFRADDPTTARQTLLDRGVAPGATRTPTLQIFGTQLIIGP